MTEKKGERKTGKKEEEKEKRTMRCRRGREGDVIGRDGGGRKEG
jgi:hypothetical protein